MESGSYFAGVPKRPWKTDYWLWGMASFGVFVCITIADPFRDIGKGDNFWVAVREVLVGNNREGSTVSALVFQTFLFAILGIAIGWPFQALAVVCGLRLRRQPDQQPQNDYDDKRIARSHSR